MKRPDPKYRSVSDTLREEISSGLYSSGDKLPTELELSERFQISRQTLRQAIGILENEGIVIRRQGSGMYVAEAVVGSKSSKTIGFISTNISGYVFPSIISGVEKVVSESGFLLNLAATANRVDNERKILLGYLDNPPYGLIVEGTKTAFPNPNLALYEKLFAMGVKVVFINGYYPQLADTVYVVTDDREGGRIATEHLISLGHSRIGGVFKADDMQGHERYAGFAETMYKHGLEIHDNEIIWFTTETHEQSLFEYSGQHVVNNIKECSAVLCYNDQIAAPLVDILLSRGTNVPGDVSVISFDNTIYSDLTRVKITSLEHPKVQLGIIAAQKLIGMIGGKKESSVMLPWILVEKGSTGKI